jgi:hypothetical protein
VTALAIAGIVMFAVALPFVAFALGREAVRYVRDVRALVGAGYEAKRAEQPLGEAEATRDLLRDDSR